MKMFKRALSCFMAAVMALTMMCGLTVSVGAEEAEEVVEEYGSEYFLKGKYVPGTDDYSFILYYSFATAYAISYYYEYGYSAIFNIMFEKGNKYFTILFSSKGFIVADINGKGKAEQDKNTSVDIDFASDTTAATITMKASSASAKYIDLLKDSPICSVQLNFAGPDGTLWSYDSITGGLVNGHVWSSCDWELDFNKKSSQSTAKKISSIKISSISDRAYTGKAIKPSVTIKDGTKTLKNGTDYTLTYKNNTKIGKATVTIKGKGSYTGEKTVSFNIVPGKPTLKVSKKSDTKATFTWGAIKGAEKYEIYYSANGGKYKKLATVSGSKKSYTSSKLDFKKNDYKFKIRAYDKVGDKTYYGAFSKIVTVK